MRFFFPGVSNYKFFILTAAAINFVFNFYYLSVNPGTEKKEGISWFIDGGDTEDYMSYAESMLVHHEYKNNLGEFVSRVPGYPLSILLFRSLAGANTTKSLLVMVQILLGGLCIYLLSITAYKVFNSPAIFYLVFFIYGLQQITKIWDSYVLSESLANSALIISVYYLVRFSENLSSKNIFISGLAFCYSFFLRPFVLPLAILFLLAVVIILWRKKYFTGKIIFTSFIFLSSFLICDGLWAYRNYSRYKEIILTQVGRYPGMNPFSNNISQTVYISIWDWINAVGENALCWDPNSLGAYILAQDSHFTPEHYDYPSHVLAAGYTKEDLENARRLYAAYKSENDALKADSMGHKTIMMFQGLKETYIKEKPFQYYVMSRVRLFKYAFFHAGPVIPVHPFPEIKRHPLELVVKLFSIGIYFVILFSGIIGSFFMLVKKRSDPLCLLISLMPLALIFILNFMLRNTEFRLFTLIFPFLVISGCYMIMLTFNYTRSLLK